MDRNVFKGVKECVKKVIAVIFFPFRMLKYFFAAVIAFVLLCYVLAFCYPKPLDYAVLSVNYFFFGSVNTSDDIKRLIKYEEPSVGEVYDTQGKIIIKVANEYRRINDFSDFSPIVIGAVLSTEDRRFFEHDGVDYWVLLTSVPWDVAGASWKVINRHRPYFKPTLVMSRGGSTLTQQAVRLFLLSEITRKEKGERLIVDNWRTRILAKVIEVNNVNTILRKIAELREAIYVEKEFIKIFGSKQKAKEEIFARYANSVYLGSCYGLGYCAEFYFGKSVNEFINEDAPKAALLAGMIKYPLPKEFSLRREIPDKNLVRKNKILRLIAVNKYISQQDVTKFMRQDIVFVPIVEEKTSAPSVVNDIREELKKDGFNSDDLFNGFIRVNSTIDLRMQDIVNIALENGLLEYEKRHPQYTGQIQGSVIILRNMDGAILSEVGGRKYYQGRTYKYSDINRVNRARQAGSAFKPFVYLTAYMNGWKPDNVITDSPFSVNMGYGRGWHTIGNYDRKYIGAAPLETMLYRSRNVPTVKLTLAMGDGEKSGMEKVAETVKMLGVESPIHSDVDHKGRRVYYITSALGASEMTLKELTNAYREMASGVSASPYIVSVVTNRKGKNVFKKDGEYSPSEISSQYLAMIQQGLRKVVVQPGGTAYSLTVEKFPVQVMGKTGTTNDFRNALFIGSTYGIEGLTVGVRIDFDDNRELGSGETGAKAALPVFKEIVKAIYENNLAGPAPQFPVY